MFGLFSGATNKEIEQAVRRELDSWDADDDLFGAIERLMGFADKKGFNQWQRTRFGVEVICYMRERGMPKKMASVFGNAFHMFIAREESPEGLDKKAFACGIDGAAQLADGLEQAPYACVDLLDDYIEGSAAQRERILAGYKCGLRALKSKGAEAQMLEEFVRIAAANAYDKEDFRHPEILKAWRSGEILPEVAKRYSERKRKNGD